MSSPLENVYRSRRQYTRLQNYCEAYDRNHIRRGGSDLIRVEDLYQRETEEHLWFVEALQEAQEIERGR